MEYTTRGRSDDERTSVLQSFKDIVGEVEEGKPEELDLDKRRAALELVLGNTKGVGQGTEQGVSLAHSDFVHINHLCRDRGVLQSSVLPSSCSLPRHFFGSKTTCNVVAQRDFCITLRTFICQVSRVCLSRAQVVLGD